TPPAVQPQPQPQTAPATTVPVPPPSSAPPPASPPVDPLRADRDAIDQVLNQYEAAWSGLDSNAVRRVHPQAPSDLQRTFDSYRSIELQLQNRQISITGNTATVVCVRATTQVLKRANTRLQASNRVAIRLRRTGTSWTIESIAQQ